LSAYPGFCLNLILPQTGDLRAAFQYLKGPTRELERGFLQGHGVTGQGIMALNREGRFRLDVRKKILHHEGGEALAQFAQRSCGCLLPVPWITAEYWC